MCTRYGYCNTETISNAVRFPRNVGKNRRLLIEKLQHNGFKCIVKRYCSTVWLEIKVLLENSRK